MRIALIGGTGKEGSGLALRWARAGHCCLIGSRSAERARAKATELAAAGQGELVGGDNDFVCRQADIAVLCVPYSAHEATLEPLRDALRGKVLIDITVPLAPPKVRTVRLPPGRAAALEAQALLGDGVSVVAALHHVSSVHLADLEHGIDTDVLVCGKKADRPVVVSLVEELGARGLEAGPLANAVALESLTPVLLFMNKRYGSAGTGIRITGIP